MADEPARKRTFGLVRRKSRPAGELVRVTDNRPSSTGKKAGLMAGVAGLRAVGTAAGDRRPGDP